MQAVNKHLEVWLHMQSKYGTVSSKITLVILFQNFQDKQKKSNACIEMYG